MIKNTLKKTFPGLYERLYSAKEFLRTQSKIEYKVLRQMVRSRIAQRKAAPWTEALPMQKAQRFSLDDLAGGTVAQFTADLDARGLAYTSDADGVYLPPETLTAAPFDVLANNYPSDVGLRMVKETTATNGVDSRGRLSRSAELGLIANLLNESKLGPRLYDIIQLELGQAVWTAYVLEDRSSFPADDAAEGLAALERNRTLKKRTLTGGGSHGTNGTSHAKKEDKQAQRFRFQDFSLAEYGTHLEQIAVSSASDTHFGDESMLRGGKFLYQSVPGVRLPAKRSTDDRIVLIEQLMQSGGFDVDGRLVLDVGCNTGMMIAEYLKRGAKWCHGWDMEAVVPRTNSLLFALGCTRFSTTGTLIEQDRRLQDDLPEFARSMLPGCVISYLAVRLHLGWLTALAEIPWSYLIYEAHQYETREDFEQHIAQLQKVVNVDVLNVSSYKEGWSSERVVAMLANASNKS